MGRYLFLFILLFPFVFFGQNSYSNDIIEEYLNQANSMFWLSRARQNALPEAERANLYIDSAEYLIKNKHLAPDCRRKYLQKINTFRKEIADLKRVTYDNLNGNFPIIPYLAGQYDQFEYFDESVETALEKALENLLQSGIYKPSKELKDVLLFTIVEAQGHPELVEVAAQYLNNNSRMYVISQHELKQAQGHTNITDSTLTILGEFFATQFLGKIVISQYENSKNVSYYGVHFEFYDLTSNELVSNTYAEGMKVDMSGKSAGFFSFFAWYVGIIILFLGLIFGIQLRVKKKEIDFIKFVFTVLVALLLGVVATLGIQTALSLIAPVGGDFIGEPRVLVFPYLVAVSLGLLPVLLLILSGLVLKRLIVDDLILVFTFFVTVGTTLLFPILKGQIVYLEQSPSFLFLILYNITLIISSFTAAFTFTYLSNRNKNTWYLLLNALYFIPVILFVFEYLKIGGTPDLAQMVTMPIIAISMVFVTYKFASRWMIDDQIKESEFIGDAEEKLLQILVSFLNNSNQQFVPFAEQFEQTFKKQIDSTKGFQHIHLDGSPGIGKTSLLQAYLKANEKEVLTFYGDCDENQEGNVVPYEPFYQAFSNQIGEGVFYSGARAAKDFLGKAQPLLNMAGVGDAVEQIIKNDDGFAGGAPREIAKKISSFLIHELKSVGMQRIVLVIDDLHWIDAHSKLLLLELLKELYAVSKKNKDSNGVILITTSSSNSSFLQEIIDYSKKLASDIDLYSLTVWDKHHDLNGLKLEEITNKSFVNQLLNESYLGLRFSRTAIREISQFVAKSDSLKPRYVLEMLKFLLEKRFIKNNNGVFELSPELNWDNIPFETDLEEIYFEQFRTLPADVLKVLESAAFVGMEFEADLLSKLWKIDRIELIHQLIKAEKIGLVVDLNDHDDFYRFASKSVRRALKRFALANTTNQDNIPQIVKEYHKEIISIHLQKYNDESLFFDSIPSELLFNLTQRALLVYPDVPIKGLRLVMSAAQRALFQGELENLETYLTFIYKCPSETILRQDEYWKLFIKINLLRLSSNPSAFLLEFGYGLKRIIEQQLLLPIQEKTEERINLELELYMELILKSNKSASLNNQILENYKENPILAFYKILIEKQSQNSFSEAQILVLNNIFQSVEQNSSQKDLKGKVTGVLASISPNPEQRLYYLNERMALIFSDFNDSLTMESKIAHAAANWRSLSYQQIEDLGFLLAGLSNYYNSVGQNNALLYPINELRLKVNQHLNHRLGTFLSSMQLLENSSNWTVEEFIEFAEDLFYSFSEGSFRVQIYPLVLFTLVARNGEIKHLDELTKTLNHQIQFQDTFIKAEELKFIQIPTDQISQFLVHHTELDNEIRFILDKIISLKN